VCVCVCVCVCVGGGKSVGVAWCLHRFQSWTLQLLYFTRIVMSVSVITLFCRFVCLLGCFFPVVAIWDDILHQWQWSPAFYFSTYFVYVGLRKRLLCQERKPSLICCGHIRNAGATGCSMHSIPVLVLHLLLCCVSLPQFYYGDN